MKKDVISLVTGGVVLVVFVFLAVGCGSTKGVARYDKEQGGTELVKSAPEILEQSKVPNWFAQVPSDPNHLYAANTQVSQDLQLAINKASTGARTEIARQVEVKLQGMQKRFAEEVGAAENSEFLQSFTEAEKTIVSTTLTGSRIKEQFYHKEGDTWRAYILVEYPTGAASSALLKNIQSKEAMYTRYRATQAFQDLEKEVEKYEKFKAEQGQ
ncbi:hypothetical protein CHS0354_000546 [Potamilus streckersoni]|uniref:Lipoprotein n=1 Tax=Potamilus streckersoni TaxID=2493646 RepID=A0AAE0T809_9BIVA|nr:hypothetical protein CHS0354_000546 [Potamilus streckersoni]